MEHDFKSGTPNSATVGAVSTEVLAAKSGRMYAVITNNSDEDMWLSLGTAAILNKGIPLKVNQSFEINGFKLFRGAVYAISTSGSKSVATFEA